METDRRGTRRFALSLPVEARGESPFNPQPVEGRTQNVSAKGIYFVCDEAYMSGQLLHIKMKLSGDKAAGTDSIFLTVRCRVQRVDKMSTNGAGRFGVAVALDE